MNYDRKRMVRMVKPWNNTTIPPPTIIIRRVRIVRSFYKMNETILFLDGYVALSWVYMYPARL